MSSEWRIVSPSMASAGPGGCPVDDTIASNPVSVSAGELPFSAAMSLPWSLVRLKPDPASLTKNEGGLIFAVAVICASTSCTLQSVHSDRLDHCASFSPRRSADRALRSAWISGQISISSSRPFLRVLIGRRKLLAPYRATGRTERLSRTCSYRAAADITPFGSVLQPARSGGAPDSFRVAIHW